MYEIASLILEYKENQSEAILAQIYAILKPLILKYSKKVSVLYQEDILQELMMGTLSIIQQMKIQVPEIEKEAFMDIENQKNPSKKYYSNFVQEVEQHHLMHLLFADNYQKITELFHKFCIRNQFYYLLEQRYRSIIATFYRENSNYFYYEIRILNVVEDSGLERIDRLVSLEHQKYDFERYGITEKDALFLKLFIDGNCILSQKEVAKKLGVSQQSISKRLKGLRKKYQTKL